MKEKIKKLNVVVYVEIPYWSEGDNNADDKSEKHVIKELRALLRNEGSYLNMDSNGDTTTNRIKYCVKVLDY